jgi:hypothetical protein
MQATTVNLPPEPPAPPSPRTVTTTGVDGRTQVLNVPMTAQEIRDLRAQRSELSNQLTSAADRRRRLASDLVDMPQGPARSGLEQRIMVLDQRMVQLESDIAATGRQLSEAPLGLPELGRPFQGRDMPDNVAAIVGAFTFLVLFPIAIAFARRIWKRGGASTYEPSPLPAHIDQRLDRLEQGIDAIAIEIERVTEGQRFVTRLLSESQGSIKLPEERVTANRE